VLDQLRLASVYRNKLVEIELARRAATDDTLRELCPGLLECEAELADVNAKIAEAIAEHKAKNAKARCLTDDKEIKAALTQLKCIRKELATTRKRLRDDGFSPLTEADLSLVPGLAEATKIHAAAENPHAKAKAAAVMHECRSSWLNDPSRPTPIRRLAIQIQLAEIGYAANEAQKTARKTSGLAPGSYLLVDQAADAFRKGAPPVFRGYQGEGRVGVQIVGGMNSEEANSGRDTRLRIVHTPQAEQRVAKNGRVLPAPGAKRQAQQYTLWLRIGSDGRTPTWATWPLILHRPIPETTRIMWAIVQRRIVGGHERWQLTLNLRDDTNAAFARRDVTASGVCGVDIGYRYIDDRAQRVAYWHGSDGASGELQLPSGKVAQWKKVDDLQSIRDGLHNEARAALRDWLATNAHPEWLDEATEHMHAWRRLSRLDRLVAQWRGQRFDGDAEIMATLESWRTRERHLWQYQEQMRDQLLAWRKDFYRNFAAMLRRRYRTIAVEDMDLRSAIHDVLRPEEERETVTAQRRAARFAALSVLVAAIKDSGADVVAVEQAGTTSTCSWCGASNEVGTGVIHTCVGCGREWDRDDNAARNICARGEVAVKTR